MPEIAPYGAWSSPLSADVVATAGLRLGEVAVDGSDVYWMEGRPADGGRAVIVRRRADGLVVDVTPREMNVRTRVHEYGGGAFAVADGVIYASHFADDRLYRIDAGLDTPSAPEPVTAAAPCRYADVVVDTARSQLIAVREDHTAGGVPQNALVRIPLTGAPTTGAVIAEGHDFYATPRLSPDGSRLAWIAWRHPQMPWDGTELWVADVTPEGTLANAGRVAGGERESIYQPGWSPTGVLCFVSDRDGWWKPYRLRGAAVEPIIRNPPADAEFGRPQWICGTATWAFSEPDRFVTAYTRDGQWRLGMVHVPTGMLTDVSTDLAPREWLAATSQYAVFVGGAPTQPDAVVRVDLESGRCDVLRSASEVRLDPGYLSTPEPITCPTDDGRTAHAFYYAPRNKDAVGPRGARPPLIVVCHGGPTTAARATLDLALQFWTSRGFAVADVNYRGSTGYGREYRELLNGQWGVADVEDVVAVARHLVMAGRVDVRRLVIRGGSAGGYTALATLAFHPGVFAAGASYYGISDIEVLARDTHKFEARYLDTLIGPYPEARATYRARSPLYHVDKMASALILFQGLEDTVVPPAQSRMMADAVRAKGLPVEYLAFEGEQHGFRRAETIARSLAAELAFYLAVFAK